MKHTFIKEINNQIKITSNLYNESKIECFKERVKLLERRKKEILKA